MRWWFILQLLYVFITKRKGWINVHCFVLLYAWWWPCPGLKGEMEADTPTKLWKLYNLLDHIVNQIIGNKGSPTPLPISTGKHYLSPSPQKKIWIHTCKQPLKISSQRSDPIEISWNSILSIILSFTEVTFSLSHSYVMFRNIDNLFLLSFRTQQQFYPVIGNQCNFKQRTTVLWFHNYVDQSTVYFQYDAKTYFCGRGKDYRSSF